MSVTLTRMGPSGHPRAGTTLLAQAIFETTAAARAMSYLPLSNITDLEPSTYFITRNMVTVSEATSAAVSATGATVSSLNTFYSSPVVIFVACYVLLALISCAFIVGITRNALECRTAPLDRMSTLPNSILQKLELAAAARVRAAERAVECTQEATAARDGGGDSQGEEEEDTTDWRTVSLAATSKDMQKGRSERVTMEHIVLAAILMAPLLASSAVLMGLASVIWTGTQSASLSSNALTAAIMADVSTGQAMYYTLLGAVLSDDVANATVAWAALAQTRAAVDTNSMFFGSGVDAVADSALGNLHFGDLCVALSSALSGLDNSRCGAVAGGVCHSGLQAAFLAVISRAETLSMARALLVYPRAPSPAQTLALRAAMDAQYVTDMRILLLNEITAAMVWGRKLLRRRIDSF
jgi:hypothetical protein